MPTDQTEVIENEEDLSQEDVVNFLGDGANETMLDDYDKSADPDPVDDEPRNLDDDSDDKPADGDPEPGESANKSEDIELSKPGDKPGDKPDEEGDILSKSGKYTIPFEKLTEARDDRDAANKRADDALAAVEDLRVKMEGMVAKNLSEDGTLDDTAADDLASSAEFEDLSDEFPEAAKAIAALQQQVKDLTASSQVNEDNAFDNASNSHFGSIESAHEHSQEILTSKEFSDWMDSQPSILQNAYGTVFNEGTTEQVIEMLDAFKAGTESETPGAGESDVTAGDSDAADVAAKVAAAEAKAKVPDSLSEVPGDAGEGDPVERLQNSQNAGGVVDDMFAGKTSEQINALVDRLL